MYRGSRKHVLDWTEQPQFPIELLDLVSPIDVKMTRATRWMPRGYRAPDEARLETFGPRFLPGHPAWPGLETWWLKHPKGANTPNWDIACGCEIEGRPGLILVEAKANVRELKDAGKGLKEDASPNSQENHAHIGQAVEEACSALTKIDPGIKISCESHYQFANRIAFSWKLGTFGIPSILVYLGFTHDTGIGDVGEPFGDLNHWRSAFEAHVGHMVPAGVFERRLEFGGTPTWWLVRARKVIERSGVA